MPPAIRIEGISKQYRIGTARGGYRTLRESVNDSAAALWRRAHRLARRNGHLNGHAKLPSGTLAHESNGHAAGHLAAASAPGNHSMEQNGATPPERPGTFWALKDVSFDVEHGEVVGIIGRNGAGKSTLLKILSRITEPTKGKITLNGRVASLLEVGTGFHPELTGRENIYLNGAILGMTRREISRKFDEIVDFSGIEKFLETPVKRYSSGMHVRLAFAVAAHLDPEILLIDEVIAVGDYEFQKKCLGKMRDVAKGGRTVLFVSHNMAAVESLCDRGVELERSRMMMTGDISLVINDYRRRLLDGNAGCTIDFLDARNIKSVTIYDFGGEPAATVPIGRDVEIRIVFGPNAHIAYPRIFVQFDDLFGSRALTIQTPANADPIGMICGETEAVCLIRELPLAPGQYNLSIMLMENRQILEQRRDCLRLTVENAEVFEEGRGFVRGTCVARSSWSCRHAAKPTL
ncbi:MAG: ABC transporter ATP-binding protein [Pirellulales bacterium]|nr:ABC transporter ATP-binding protein [Pirellulales bacterium]